MVGGKRDGGGVELKHLIYTCVHCEKEVVTPEPVISLRGGEGWECPACGGITIVQLNPMR